jgi:hypothetical protein
MGDLEQQELRFLARDQEIGQYDYWWYEDGGAVEIPKLTWETLVSWHHYVEYCLRCGAFAKATKTATNKQWYQLECKHYCPRWDYDHDWDEELGWIPKGYKG